MGVNEIGEAGCPNSFVINPSRALVDVMEKAPGVCFVGF
jgi:hypothetical protein